MVPHRCASRDLCPMPAAPSVDFCALPATGSSHVFPGSRPLAPGTHTQLCIGSLRSSNNSRCLVATLRESDFSGPGHGLGFWILKTSPGDSDVQPSLRSPGVVLTKSCWSLKARVSPALMTAALPGPWPQDHGGHGCSRIDACMCIMLPLFTTRRCILLILGTFL